MGCRRPPGHPPGACTGPSGGGQAPVGMPGGAAALPAGHPSIAPGAAASTSDELLRKMDATPDLKTRPKPYEVSAAIGKLYYGRARWADARDFFLQAEKTAEPVRALFLEQRKPVKGALPDRGRRRAAVLSERLGGGEGSGAGPEPRRREAARASGGLRARGARPGPRFHRAAREHAGADGRLEGRAGRVRARPPGRSPERARPVRPWRGHLRGEGRRPGGAEDRAEGAPDLGGGRPERDPGAVGPGARPAHRSGHRRRGRHEVRTPAGEDPRRGEAGGRGWTDGRGEAAAMALPGRPPPADRPRRPS